MGSEFIRLVYTFATMMILRFQSPVQDEIRIDKGQEGSACFFPICSVTPESYLSLYSMNIFSIKQNIYYNFMFGVCFRLRDEGKS